FPNDPAGFTACAATTVCPDLLELDAISPDGDYFLQTLSKLQRALRKRLGVAAAPYLIDNGERRPRRYRLRIAPENIRFV
ncbi:MAG: hypothetical protein LBF51_10140, partial [Zoogloeaceae bacterium]|nr:hypothetical protein [Zoogloeaceae bacterium]